MKKRTLAFCVLAVALPGLAANAAEHYVSPSGSDTNPGTLIAPWRTIEKARDTIRTLDLPDGGVTVWIRGGTYFIEETIVFDERDSGTAGKPIAYKAYPFEEPVFCGGREITGWTLDSGNIHRATVDVNTWRFDQLFENGVRKTKARFPNTGYLRTDKPTGSPKLQIRFKQGDLPTWNNYEGAQLSIWNYANWFQNVLPVSSINFNSRVINLSSQAPQLNLEGDRYFIQGVKAELDAPGEFHLNESNGKLYYWPVSLPIEDQSIVAPVVTNIFAFKGSSPGEPVKHVSLEGLTIRGSRFTPVFRSGGYSSTGPEYSVNRPGEGNRQGLVQLENASRITVRNSRLYNAGYCGVSLGFYASHNTVYGNEIRDCGWHGILMVGKDNGVGVVDDPSEQIYDNKFNSISNNHIHRCGQIIGDAAGVYLYQSGDNVIEHNLVHRMPRYGICMKGHGGLYGKYTKFGNVTITDDNYWDFYTGNNNIIRYNHVYDLLNDSYDAGGISLRKPGRYNTIGNNRIHDINTPASMDHYYSFGIYLDGGTEYTTVTNNVIYNVKPGKSSFATPINMKKLRNTVTNNIIVAETGTTGGVIAMQEGGGEQPEGEGFGRHRIERNVFYAKGRSATLYWFKSEDEFTASMVSASNKNLFYLPDGGTPIFKGIDGDDTYDNWKALYNGKYDKNSVTANPLFVDVAHHNFKLKAASPVWALGFQEIDQDRAGLKDDYPVAHSPRPYDSQSKGTLADVLAWTGGSDATTFDVYLGSSNTSVVNADVDSNSFRGNQAKSAYAPQSLAKNKWYYWRIDERKDGNLISRGDVWKFRTIEAVVDTNRMDLVATNAASTLDINTQAEVMTYDEDGGGPAAPVIFPASVAANTATWTFGDLTIGSKTTLTISGNNTRAMRFVATGLGPIGAGNIVIEKDFNLNGAAGAGNGTPGGVQMFGGGAGGDDEPGASVRAGRSGASDAYKTVGGIGGGRYNDNDTEHKGGGGGAFGGDGGDSNTGTPRGGSWYGRLDLSKLGTSGGPRGGSGGGAGNRGSGGSGGGAIQLLAVNDIRIAGGVSITAKGGRGSSSSVKNVEKRRSGGGGSGGGIRIVADSDRDGSGILTAVGSTLNASGAPSNNTTIDGEYGGDGGGGRIALSGASVVSGTVKVPGGDHGRVGSWGEDGSILVDAKGGLLSLSGNGPAVNAYTQYTSLAVSARSTLEPGGAGRIGMITVDNASPVTVAGTLNMDLKGTGSGSADQLIVTNALAVTGATLDLDAINSPNGDVHVLIRYGSLAGTFAKVKNLPAGYTLDHAYGGNQVALVPDGFEDVDTDGDGWTNGQEIFLGTDPLDSTDTFRVLIAAGTIKRNPGDLVEFHLRWNSIIGRTYIIESSVDVADWTQAASLAGDGNEQLHTVRTADDVGFFRLRVE